MARTVWRRPSMALITFIAAMLMVSPAALGAIRAGAGTQRDYRVSGLGRVTLGFRYQGLITGQLSAGVQSDSLTVILTPPRTACPLNSDRADASPGAISVALLAPGPYPIHALLRSSPVNRKGVWHVCTYVQGVVDPNTIPDEEYFTTFRVVRGRAPTIRRAAFAPDYTVRAPARLRRGSALRVRVRGVPPQGLQSDTFTAVLIPPGIDCPQNAGQAAEMTGAQTLAYEFFNQSPFHLRLYVPRLLKVGIWSLCTYVEGFSNPNTVPDEYDFVTVKVVRAHPPRKG